MEEFLKSINISSNEFSISAGIFLGIILVGITLSILVFYKSPQLFIKYYLRLLIKPFINLKVDNRELLKSEKGYLIIANSISILDPILISLAVAQKVYFIGNKEQYKFKHLFSFIDKNNHKKVKKLISEGAIVCLFPEENLTKNGILDKFSSDYQDYLPEDNNDEIPVKLIYIANMWQSLFSNLYKKGRLTLKAFFSIVLRHKATLCVATLKKKNVSPFFIRLELSELSSSIELIPTKNERVLYHQFARRARLFPWQKPLIDGSTNQKLSNFKVYSKALALSNYIKEICDENEKYVGVLLPNTPASAVVILAVMFANKVPAVLNFTVSAETQTRSIKNARIKHVLTSKKFLLKAKISETPEMIMLEKIGKSISKPKALWTTLKGYLLPLPIFLGSHGLKDYKNLHKEAILLFSSGSTAEPKGVCLTHHNLNANLKSFFGVVNITHKDGIVGNLPLFHSFGMNVCFWIPLATGVKVAYIPNPLDAESIVKSIEKYQLSVITATPTFMQSYMRKMKPEKITSLRLIITGAERLRDEIIQRFEKISNHSTTIIEGYGCTELSPIVSINLAKNIDYLGKKTGKNHSIGIAMPGITVKIFNPETLKEVPANTDGLIMVKSDTVMKGYLNNQALTDEVMVNGYYNTKDIGQMTEDGYITITGRLSRFSKIAGEMIPHESIEQQIYKLLNTHELKIVVTGARDKHKGEKIIVFHTKEMTTDPQKIILSLREQKIPNLWIPRPENFIQIEAIPVLGTGKIDLGKIGKLAEKYNS